MGIRSRRIKDALSRIVFWGLLGMFLMSACSSITLEIHDDSPIGTVWKLNKNLEGLQHLASACMNADSVAIFSLAYNEDGSVLYWLSMKTEGDIELFSEVVSEEVFVPELSMNRDEGVFYWTVNGSYLMDSDGNRISVTDLTKPISFLVYEDVIRCQVNDVVVGEYPVTKAVDYLARDVSVDYDLDNCVFNLQLSSGFSSILPTISGFHMLEENVQNQSFYKDVFLDAGIALTSKITGRC